MKLGYIGLPDGRRTQDIQFKAQEKLMLADSLGFASAYFPKICPKQFIASQDARAHTIKVTLDASAFGSCSPSELVADVRQVNAKLGGRLNLGVEICGRGASSKSKADGQAFETLFSYDPRVDQVFSPSRFPMAQPCPEIVGLPITGFSDEAKIAAARGYFPMSPAWLQERDVARIWPAIVAGATSALRRARQSLWQVNRVVLVHDDAQTLSNYMYGSNSPIRRHFTNLARLELIDADVDAHIKRVVIAGSAQRVAEDILALREVVGDFGMLNMVDPFRSDPSIMRKTMVRLAEDVLPIVTRSNVSHMKNLEKI